MKCLTVFRTKGPREKLMQKYESALKIATKFSWYFRVPKMIAHLIFFAVLKTFVFSSSLTDISRKSALLKYFINKQDV